MTYAEFERLLAVYGSDRTRWPVDARKAAASLVARDAGAARLLAEAEALDRVLDRAPLPTLVREAALTERIVAAAQRSPRVVAVGGPVAGGQTTLDLAARVPRASVSLRLLEAGRSGMRFATSKAGIGAMLSAASLAAGILIGATNPSQSLLRPVQQLAGIALSSTNPAIGMQFDTLYEDLL